jgi:hypothetical protein
VVDIYVTLKYNLIIDDNMFIFILSLIMINDNMKDLIFNMEKVDDRLVITITDKEQNHKGILYFERVKAGFNRKPISMNSWACIDSKIEGLYDMGDFSSLDVLNRCQELIREYDFSK